MRNIQRSLIDRVSLIAVRSAITALAIAPLVHAADSSEDAVRDLTQRVSQIEAGVSNVDKSSA